MRFDRFGFIAIASGAIILALMSHFVYSWNLLTLVTAAVSGAVLVFALSMIMIGILLMVL